MGRSLWLLILESNSKTHKLRLYDKLCSLGLVLVSVRVDTQFIIFLENHEENLRLLIFQILEKGL